jgi:MFS family permease
LTRHAGQESLCDMAAPSLWRSRNFRLMCASATATNLGDGVMAVAVPWLATLLTGDPFLIGLVAGARSLPWFLFALPAGVITDRFDHRRILCAADALRILVALALLVLALTASPGTGPVLGMAGLTFLLGCAEVLRDNTAQTFVPAVVGREDLERANGTLWACEQLAGQFIGPPLAGFLIGVSVALPFGLHAGLLAAGVAAIVAMTLPRRSPSTNATPPLAALREGVVWLWRNVMLRRLALLLGGFNFLGYGYFAIFVLYGQRVLGVDAVGYGLLLTLAACGALAATLVGPVILRRMRPGTAIQCGMVVFSLTCAVLALQPPWWVVAVMMAVDGFAGMLWNIAQVSYRQRHIPAPLLGRVNSAFRFVGTGPSAFGAVAFGALVGWAEPAGAVQAVLLPYWVAAGTGAVLAGYALWRLRLD